MKIIGFTGKAGSGKDTAAHAIRTRHPEFGSYFHYSFASPLRKGLAAMLGDAVEIQSHHPELKNQIVPAYGVSPRTMLQTLGTEWGRNMINDGIWIIRAKQIWEQAVAAAPDTIILISDCRFDNEAEAILEMGGRVIEIVRPINPHTKGIETGGVSNHTSEAGVNPKLVSYTVTNAFDLMKDFETRIITDPFINSYLQ